MAIRNASFVTREVVKYLNQIINRVFKVKSADIERLGTDFDNADSLLQKRSQFIEDSWEQTQISNVAVINGIPVGLSNLNRNFVKNLKQYKIFKSARVKLSGGVTIFGSEQDGGVANDFIAKTYDNLIVVEIQAPDGYDGNASFIDFSIPKDQLDNYGANKEAIVDAFDNTTGGTEYRSRRLFDYWGEKFSGGKFEISVSKNTNGITVTIDTNGKLSKVFAGDQDPEIMIDVDFYRWGIR